MITTKPAGELQVGDKVLEEIDGLAWTVESVSDYPAYGSEAVLVVIHCDEAEMLMLKPERARLAMDRSTNVFFVEQD